MSKKVASIMMFLNENDLLEIKLNEEKSYVDKFVIVESLQTHVGNTKDQPMFDKKRFKKFEKQIDYILIESLDGCISKYPHLLPQQSQYFYSEPDKCRIWQREKIQTNMGLKHLIDNDWSDDDLVMFGGLDEIVSSKTMDMHMQTFEKEPQSLYMFNLQMYVVKLNIWAKTIRGQLITNLLNHKKKLTSELRLGADFRLIYDAGWHFSGISLGNKELRYKYSNFSHALDDYWVNLDQLTDHELYEKVIRSYIPDFFEKQNFYTKPITTNFLPQYIVDNQDKFQNLMHTVI